MRPALPIVVLTLVGAVVGVAGACEPDTAAAAAIAAASLAIVAPPFGRHALLFVALFAVAAADGAFARRRALDSPMSDWFASIAPGDRLDEAIPVSGILVEDAFPTELGVHLAIDAESILIDRRWRSIRGRLSVHVSGGLAPAHVYEWTAGRRVSAPVLLRRPLMFRNPGSRRESWQRLARSADLVGTIKSAAVVQIQPGHTWHEVAAQIRQHVRRAASRHVSSAQSAAVVAAILIGDRTGLSDDVQRRLRAAGTYHVIAISGGNIALLTAVCVMGLRLVVRRFQIVALMTIAVVSGYGWIVGGDPSVRRAVLAACLYLVLSLAGLKPRALNVVGLVLMILTLFDPLIVVDVGAWLSFGATLAIVLGTSRLMAWATGQSILEPPPRSWLRRCRLTLLGLLSATVAAETVLLPISATVFSRVSAFGLVLNFIAIPAMAVVQLSGFVMAALAGQWEAGAAFAGNVADTAARLLIDSSAAVDIAPWLTWRVPPAGPIWTCLFYAGGLGILLGRRWNWRRYVAGTFLVLGFGGIVTAPALTSAGPAGGWLRITVLDVGQGDSLLVQFPSGQAMLIDAGGARGATEFGTRVVTPAIWALGVRRLNWIAMTHGDIDHVGGAVTVARDLEPREIWEGVPVASNLELRTLHAEAQRGAVVWRQLLKGHRFDVGSVRVDVLHPPQPDWERPRVRNDDSLVMRLRFGDVEMLLTGDAGQEFEQTFALDDDARPIRLLKVGHHGSRTSSSRALITAYQPQLAFISVGRGNLFGHPAPDVLARYRDIGARVFRTDRDGAIVIETDGATVNVRTWTGKRWTLTLERN